MIKSFRKFSILSLCAFIYAHSICSAVPPGRGDNPNLNIPALEQKFQNLGHFPASSDGFGNLQIVYHQGGSRWDYRDIWVMNHAGAFGNESDCMGIFAQLQDLFQELVSIPQHGIGALNRWVCKFGGGATAFEGAAVGSAYGAARFAAKHVKRARKIVFDLSKSLGLNERVIYEALKNIAKWLIAHPGTVALIVGISSIGVILAVRACARGRQLERDIENVTQLFQDMILFLRNKRYKGGNLICYAIDKRELGFFSIFQTNLGTWIGPMNIPNLHNAVVDKRYYGKFEDLTDTINTFFRSEGVARSLGLTSEEERSEA
jgi:hypothetical protein